MDLTIVRQVLTRIDDVSQSRNRIMQLGDRRHLLVGSSIASSRRTMIFLAMKVLLRS